MRLPELGEVVMLYPAPLDHIEPKPGKRLPLRRVQDGAGNFRRFLPEEGAERPFDLYWHDRYVRGDVLLTDSRTAYSRAVAAAPPVAERASQPLPAATPPSVVSAADGDPTEK